MANICCERNMQGKLQIARSNSCSHGKIKNHGDSIFSLFNYYRLLFGMWNSGLSGESEMRENGRIAKREDCSGPENGK